jgi:hydrogenase maturation protease
VTESRNMLVLGLGNVLCGDDGLGVAAVARLAERWEVAPEVRVADGGTLGLSLLGLFDGMDEVLLVDAILADAVPGSLVALDGDEVAPAARARLSVHQVGVADLLDALDLLGTRPRRLSLVGLVPERIELGMGRSAPVERALPGLVDRVAREIQARGHTVVPRRSGGAHAQAPVDRDAARALGL